MRPARHAARLAAAGEHSEVASRPAMDGVVLREVVREQLTVHPDAAADGDDCAACYCYEISSADNPVASLPGCTDPAHRCCVAGCLDRLAAAGRLLYVEGADGDLPPPSFFCAACKDAEVGTWGSHLRRRNAHTVRMLRTNAVVAR